MMVALAWSLKAAFEAELQRSSLSYLELLHHTSADLVSSPEAARDTESEGVTFFLCVCVSAGLQRDEGEPDA